MMALNAEPSNGAILTGSKFGAPHCKKPVKLVKFTSRLILWDSHTAMQEEKHWPSSTRGCSARNVNVQEQTVFIPQSVIGWA